MNNEIPVERRMLMSMLDCDGDKLEIILNLFKRFEKTYGKSIIPTVIREFHSEYEADYVISGLILEVLDQINKTYNIDIEYLSLNHKESGFEFNLVYLEEYLNEQNFDELTREKIKDELISWHVVY